MNRKFSGIIAAVAIAGSLTACGSMNAGYGGVPYVVGKYVCQDPTTGFPAYCVEYNDGTSSIVPFYIYNSIGYGYGLTYVGHRYTVIHTSYSRRGFAPRVTHVTYRIHSYTSTRKTGGYVGRNYVNKGRVVYRAPAGTGYHSTYHSSVRSRY